MLCWWLCVNGYLSAGYVQEKGKAEKCFCVCWLFGGIFIYEVGP